LGRGDPWTSDHTRGGYDQHERREESVHHDVR
jgi:hypothetical protein